MAFNTSFLWTGPIAILTTGILAVVFKNSRSASSDPKVDACTQTPSLCLSTYLSRISQRLSSISAFASYTSWSVLALNSSEPAIAFSRPGAAIFIPMEPLIFWWWIYSALTLISFNGYGVNKALIYVTIGPLKPWSTIVS